MKYFLLIGAFLNLFSSCGNNSREDALKVSQREERRIEYKKALSLLPTSRQSPAALINNDGEKNMLIRIRPNVVMDELGCTMMSDGMGNTFSQQYYVIFFSLDNKAFYSIWGVAHGKGPPITLDPNKEYKFMIKPLQDRKSDNTSVLTDILQIWDKDKIIYEK